VISRAGSTIFEIASWELPSIIIPITDSNENHQVKNAFAYAHAGACSVIQEENLKTHIFIAEIRRILGDKELAKTMKEGAKGFFKPGAADQIAEELLSIIISHEKLE
jgi:UDP-N-acetylglucosamine--N-acetylmuramyl-(pentapeptide) pyrophosphoryl-undecaprenol N-acetylglucosamine transferase